MQKHLNAAFLNLMTRLNRKYDKQGQAMLPSGMSKHNKINALAQRRISLLSTAARTRSESGRTRHLNERGRWADPPSDEAVKQVI